jgi:hypothetical protein
MSNGSECSEKYWTKKGEYSVKMALGIDISLVQTRIVHASLLQTE